MKNLYLLLLSIGLFSNAIAQTTIKGTVVSKSDGLPIPGATVLSMDDTQNGVVTDFDGNFSLVVNQASGKISISFIGYAKIELSYTGDQTFQIEMEDDLTSLDEVVIIGYGSAKKGDIVTAVSTVDNIETLSSRPVSSLNEFLQGNVPGLTVTQQGGSPASSGKIVIRGIGSLNNQDVLTVVDGVIYNGPQISPNDIASVSVLKDAAAAAIYGAQAAAGVIVIETKKGKIGKPVISIDTFAGIKQVSNLPTPLNARQQADVYNLAVFNAGSSTFQSAHDGYQNPWGQVTRTNFIEEVFRNAQTNNVNVNISGASETVNYSASVGYFKQEGVLLGTDSERYTLRVRSDYKLTDKLTIGQNVNVGISEAVGANTRSGYSGVLANAMYMPSAAPVYDEFGEFHGVAPYDLSQFAGAYGDVYNPVALLLRPIITSPTFSVNANLFLEYDIIDDLTYRSSFAYNTSQDNYKRFDPKRPELGRTNLTNSLLQSTTSRYNWIWDNQISYDKSFGDHKINATAIYSAQFHELESSSVYGEGFSSEAAANQYIGNASTFNRPPTSNVSERALLSMIARATYDYKGKYFVTGSIRRDESSRLHPDNQVDYFSAVSAGWRISNEDFFNVKGIDDLKFRASWGEIGNIGSIGVYSFDVPLGTQISQIGENGRQNDKGVFAERNSNPNLLWERIQSTNIGIDLDMFDYKLGITADYYIKETEGMVFTGSDEKHSGLNPAQENAGLVENKGIEIAVNYRDKIGDLNYTIRANASKIKNELKNLDGYGAGGDVIIEDENLRAALQPFRTQVGRELFTNFLVPQLGIFQNQAEIDAHSLNGNLIQPNAVPGDFKFADTNGDGKIDADDREYMGSYQPDYTYSFGASLDYKGFDLNFSFYGVTGVSVFNGYKYLTLNAASNGFNLDNRVLNAWTPSNTNTDIPRISTKDNNNNFGTTSDWYLEDASFSRLRNIAIGYTLPESAIKGANLRLFLSAENLFTITNYSGLDPEVGGKGMDAGQYPVSKTFSLGLSLKL